MVFFARIKRLSPFFAILITKNPSNVILGLYTKDSVFSNFNMIYLMTLPITINKKQIVNLSMFNFAKNERIEFRIHFPFPGGAIYFSPYRSTYSSNNFSK